MYTVCKLDEHKEHLKNCPQIMLHISPKQGLNIDNFLSKNLIIFSKKFFGKMSLFSLARIGPVCFLTL
jgi:hypothetical protein